MEQSEQDLRMLWGLLAQRGHYPEGEEAQLLREWFELQSTFPHDGWDGAALAIGLHVGKMNACEAKLREYHERHFYSQHGPERRAGPYGGEATGKCICGVKLPVKV